MFILSVHASLEDMVFMTKLYLKVFRNITWTKSGVTPALLAKSIDFLEIHPVSSKATGYRGQ